MRPGHRRAMLCTMKPASVTAAPYWQVPRLRPERRWLGGVAAAIAVELGVEPLVIRLAFVVLTMSGGLGLALYAAAWLWFTYAVRASDRESPDGYVPVPKGKTRAHRIVGVLSVVVGAMLAARRALPAGVHDAALWPVAVAAFGLLLAWSSGEVDWSEPRELARAAGGLSLIAAGVIGFIVLNFGRTVAPQALLLATGILSLVVTIVAPWLWRAAAQVSHQRLERARAVERAELAAHLHDSVLQTLSLITRNADDPAATRKLARRQERELRQWLFGGTAQTSENETFREALARTAAEVEDQHGVPIETVSVGDGPGTDERMQALLAATREALVNASRHSGAASVDLFGEFGANQVEVFVRDKGCGFVAEAVPTDRRGLEESVVGRMQRMGGQASVTSNPGHGTEVVLVLPLDGPVGGSHAPDGAQSSAANVAAAPLLPKART